MKPPLEVLQEIAMCSDILREYFATLHEEVTRLEQENQELRTRLNQNSNNSSKPPSSDVFVKPKSLRTKSGRKPGGQPGHKGITLRKVPNPDRIEIHSVEQCSCCGQDLSRIASMKYSSRQVFDVVIKREVTEHRVDIKQCPGCQHTSTAAFPPGVEHYVQYGPIYRSFMVCLNQGHFVPFDRLAAISKTMLGISASPGTLVNIIQDCHVRLADAEEAIKKQLLNAGLLHFDETGTRVDGQNNWIHVAGNSQFTHYACHEKRGNVATDVIGILPQFKGIAIHDFWKPYFKYTQCKHALCNVHILRELTGVIENTGQQWASDMKTLLLDMNQLVDKAGGMLDEVSVAKYEVQYDAILDLADSENPIKKADIVRDKGRGRPKRSKERNLIDRLKLNKQQVLLFMRSPAVPFDNNQAERDIRMAKLHRKISGGFRSDEGKTAFCRIRSYISSATKQGIDMFSAIYAAKTGNPVFVQ
ncbi:MAG: IS66 family transposase [Thermincola sp.]|jgi:transposase|nr:IS66 family transposase [Thermincola sp.]MDT3703934.1 IS66 family transposase [Thermincola sp.]